MDAFIHEADELVERKYRFNNPWDMECCRDANVLIDGHAYYSPNGDPEWCYMFARLEFLRKLLLAYEDTQDCKYIEAYIREVQDFYSENTIKNGQLKEVPVTFARKLFEKGKGLLNSAFFHKKHRYATYRTLDTAIRNYALLSDLQHCHELKNNINYSKFLMNRLSDDIPFVVEKFADFDYHSNWGLIRLTLYVSCKLINGEQSIAVELEQIKAMLVNQVRPDGGHIECSLMYHMQVLICLLRMIYQMHLREMQDADIEETAEKMALYAYHLADCNNDQVMYGDSDHTNIDTVMAIAESTLNLKYRMHIDVPTDRMLMFEFSGLKFDESKELLKKENRKFVGGIYVINEPHYQVRLFNETTHSNHKHADNGSVVLYYKGIPLLIDTGRCTYHNEEKRKHYKGAYGHNIAVVDDGAEWNFQSKWRFTEHPIIVENKVDNKLAVATYKFEQSGIEHKRILYIDDETVIVVSMVNCFGQHDLTTIWNTSDRADCKVGDQKIIFSVASEKIYMKWYPDCPLQIKSGRISYCYNEDVQAGRQVVIKNPFDNEGMAITVITTADYEYEHSAQEYLLRFKDWTIKIDKCSGLVTKHTL